MIPTAKQIINNQWQKIVATDMENKGITAYRMAQLIGVSRAQIGKWLKGTAEPSISNYTNLINVLYELED
jgi:transcriptional regulator with XRE-family HTH domain